MADRMIGGGHCDALAAVRRFEEAGFRAWPAASTFHDRSWLVRLTPGHPAKRLNSVNPLDGADGADLPARIARAAGRFAAEGRPLTFRMSPLSARTIDAHLDREGWRRFSESLVMRKPLDGEPVGKAPSLMPLRDVDRFVDAAIAIGNLDPAFRAGLSEVIGAIEPEVGLFVLEEGGSPVTTAVCVRDGDLASLFEVATRKGRRGEGFGRNAVLSALEWARTRGAREAWLQVEAANAAALALYNGVGFGEAYRYHYRRPSEAP